MKILMLGWEYPPMVSGGLATATEGLINGLIELGHTITLVMPYFPYNIKKNGLTIVSPENHFYPNKILNTQINNLNNTIEFTQNKNMLPCKIEPLKNHKSHYSLSNDNIFIENYEKNKIKYFFNHFKNSLNNTNIISDIFKNMTSFHERAYLLYLLSEFILEQDTNYDVIHAHDWMSFTALEGLKKFRIPLVVHIHSTELDRSGELNNNEKILLIEKKGAQIADIVIAVSEYTKKILMEKFLIPEKKVRVIYNANNEQHSKHKINKIVEQNKTIENKDKKPVVTFVGRITYQKGPSYFVMAAQIVLKKKPNVLFKVVGNGDLLPAMKQLVWELGINKDFSFEGFLNSEGVQQILKSSSIFVMPSVSEPFGIVALEAIAQKIPVIISKQSGVSEVLSHTFKIDFWDTELMADRILSLLKYAPVRTELIENSLKDLSYRTWVQSAQELIKIYTDIN